ncbi:glycoside hydrolase family 88 protein [Planctomicrobium piriforme]|uniref:Glycosyl Hydrolase Family 88 n=1 Tax=Planctomicrobium piriforme TaxID=1576369 RepID=A0A1I3E2F6_9PLAN|nr:glycoside hydrolase family 88 protein [Planctomicrobium piriforme]SFH93146.1 Glycosyl Hydrolase Family 88 [Planctomicrobium piriforme]
MLTIDSQLRPADLLPAIERMWAESARCLDELEASWSPARGSPVFTIKGEYTSQGWTEWTQGFQFGSALLQFDATGDERFLEIGRKRTIELMAPHVSHIGVHDHGFNNVSTYGTLRRLVLESKIPRDQRELDLYELALKVSGAVQASRWSRTHDGGGYIYSFNGPHSLFADTIRSLRSLAIAHQLGHRLMGENDESFSLLSRLLQHARTTADYNVYYGNGRDTWDVPGRVVHESIFNPNDGRYRCPSSQQGYSPFTTWTRGAAWIVTGYAEQLEFLATLSNEEFAAFGGKEEVMQWMERAAIVSAAGFIADCPTDGVPYWDNGAPGLVHLGRWRERPAMPFNEYEPVDSSAAAIAAQGLIRLGNFLNQSESGGDQFLQAGLTMLQTLLSETYLNAQAGHQGLLLHSVYHRPRNWDYIPRGRKIPCGEACMWGDYHLRETCLLVQRMAKKEPYYRFFGPDFR